MTAQRGEPEQLTRNKSANGAGLPPHLMWKNYFKMYTGSSHVALTCTGIGIFIFFIEV